MTESDPAQLERIFNLTLDAPQQERAAILERECGGDVGLRKQVETMIAGAQDERFLSAPTLDEPHPIAAPGEKPIVALGEKPGSRIGPYKLLQLLGEGGFGSVFMAEQEKPVARRVALKIIKLGMDTRQVVARFEQERQALALMDHPHIARVFDAGSTETGRPFFVMELCTGEAITDYCDKHNLSIAQRLSLFVQVCQAVQHAHQKGLIHRDIKPSNILVHTQDGKPHAKIIDFGIAKATASKLTEKTLFTEHKQLVGTPQYMSPEQAEGSLDIDTRTDVYSLGVLLYELLTGSTPFDSRSLRSAAYDEIQRIIREVDPPKPSTRLQQSSDTIAGIAARRDVDPKKLGTLVRGELDWIVMKALEKDRQRRYESPNALGTDIQRYLSGEAVDAAPPSRSYLLRKFARRHKGPVSAVAAVLVALMIGAVASAWQAHRARIERDKAQRVAEFMSETLKGVGPSVARGRDVTMLKEMMNAAAARIEQGDLRNSPDAELRLRDTIGTTYRELSLYPQAAKLLEPAVALARTVHRGDHAETAQALFSLACLYNDRGDIAAAEPLHREALEMRRRLLPHDSPEVADSLNDLAVVTQSRGDLAGAESLFRESIAARKRMTHGDDLEIANSTGNLAALLMAKGQLADADALFQESLSIYRRLYPGDHPRIADALTNAGTLAYMRGNLDAAERLYREALEMQRRLYPADHVQIAVGLSCLATTYFARGDFAQSSQLHSEALAIYRKVYPGDHPELANSLGNLATSLSSGGQWARGEALMLESIEMRKRLTPGGSADIAAMLINLSANRRAQKNLVGAEAAARESVDMAKRLFPGDHLRTAEAMYVLGLAVSEAGDLVRAEPYFRASAEMYRRLFKGDHPKLAVTLSDWSDILLRRGAAAAAEPPAREAAGMLDRGTGSKHWNTGSAHLRLGKVLFALNRYAEAEPELIQAEQILSTAQGSPAARLAESVTTLAQLYEQWDKAEPDKGYGTKATEGRAKLKAQSAPR